MTTGALLVPSLLLLVGGARVEQRFTREPSDVTEKAGQRLVLECGVSDQRGQCQWTKDGFGLGVKPALPGFPRYAMAEAAAGNCDLAIDPVLPADEAVYQCQVGAGPGGVAAIVSRRARVRVTAEPGLPYIRQATDADVVEVVEGEPVVLDCVSPGARPAAEIQWYQDGARLESGNIQEMVSREQGGTTFRTQSALTLELADTARVKCSSYSDSFPRIKFSRELEVRVRHLPRLSLNISTDQIREGDKFSVTCASKAYPKNVAYKWFFNGVELAGEDNETLIIEEISREHHKSAVKCSVMNEVGRTEAATSINVVFPPRILAHPASVVARRGDNVTFHCLAEANPAPVYLWTRDRSRALEAVTQNLTVVASEATEKAYVCRVFADGHEIISSLAARLQLLRRPVIYTEIVRAARRGQDVILTCLVDSLSEHTAIMWTKDDVPLAVADSSRLRVINTHQGREFNSDLLISNMGEADFGHYGCFAVNEVGRDYARIVVREEGGGAAAALVTGVAAAVLLAALLLVIAVVVVRRRHCACAQEAEGGAEEEKAPMYGLKECSVRLKRLDV